MIKTAVYAYWAKPFLERDSYSNFQRRNDLRVSLQLSVLQARKWFDKIVFYGDHEAISQICGIIDFDDVRDDVEQLNDKGIPWYFWSIPRAIACEKMEEPFVIMENDFYLWERPTEEFLNADVIVEDMLDVPTEYFDEISRMKDDDLNVRPRWYKFANKGNFKIPTKGIYGGNDLKFIGEHANEAIRMCGNEENLRIFQEGESRKRYVNAHKIFDLWYCGAKIDMLGKQPYTMKESGTKYTHLYSSKKNDPDISIRMYERARQDLPFFMQTIEDKEGVVFDPLSDYDYFVEPTKGIQNIPTPTKKLTFVMAMMNRRYQIEQTLFNNLEDNWDDRDDVEFVLMDINSKDGFRDWIREQDLTKYVECGYLRYFESDGLDTWHASIGKNTATHQARGRIVVTLDCDNYTGRGGGRFVINQFEEHDYNCVLHQFDWNHQNGNFGRIALTKEVFDKIGGYDQSLMPMGYQDWDIIKRAEGVGCEYVNRVDDHYNQAIENEGGKELSMANQTESFKSMGWTEMNRINKLKCHHNLYRKKYVANGGYYGIRSAVHKIYGAD
jgi:hypothetical protein